MSSQPGPALLLGRLGSVARTCPGWGGATVGAETLSRPGEGTLLGGGGRMVRSDTIRSIQTVSDYCDYSDYSDPVWTPHNL